MAGKADLFHLAPGYVPVDAEFHIEGSPLSGKGTCKTQSFKKRWAGFARLVWWDQPFWGRVLRGEGKHVNCFQGDKQVLVPSDPAMTMRKPRAEGRLLGSPQMNRSATTLRWGSC